MKTLRVFFSKTGRAAYISHLDLSRTMQRAIKRAGLPVWYTEGFNPHIYLTFALPLSLGHQGLHESMDLRVIEDMEPEVFIGRLNKALPAGLVAFTVAEPIMKPGQITYARYMLSFELPGADQPYAVMKSFLAQSEITVQKNSKKGKTVIDIKPDLRIEDMQTDGHTVTIQLILPAGGTKNINPGLIITALEEYTGQEVISVDMVRAELFNAEMQVFM